MDNEVMLLQNGVTSAVGKSKIMLNIFIIFLVTYIIVLIAEKYLSAKLHHHHIMELKNKKNYEFDFK